LFSSLILVLCCRDSCCTRTDTIVRRAAVRQGASAIPQILVTMIIQEEYGTGRLCTSHFSVTLSCPSP
jgi:hypothetical protein